MTTFSILFILVDEERREDPNTTISGPMMAQHYIECWLGTFVAL